MATLQDTGESQKETVMKAAICSTACLIVLLPVNQSLAGSADLSSGQILVASGKGNGNGNGNVGINNGNGNSGTNNGNYNRGNNNGNGNGNDNNGNFKRRGAPPNDPHLWLDRTDLDSLLRLKPNGLRRALMQFQDLRRSD